MDLILWRHAQAYDMQSGQSDLERPLTSLGKEQAAKMATWLAAYLPKRTRILASPARRTEQTVRALSHDYKLSDELAPGAGVAELLELVNWPSPTGAVLVVGHQPVLGQTIAELIGLKSGQCSVRKAAVWWLRSLEQGAGAQAIVLTVQAPDFL
jgi:phosphohistidine phosphatase